MQYVTHRNIDKAKWDRLVQQCVYPRIYFLSWYLDAACPGWSALIWGDYECAFPLEVKHFFLIKKVGQPLLVQQTGLFWTPQFHFKDAFEEFAKRRFAEQFISFATTLHDTVNVETLQKSRGYQVTENKNFLLCLRSSYPELQAGYNTNRKRNLKKALSLGWKCEQSAGFEDALCMYQDNQAAKQTGLKQKVYSVLKRIYDAAKVRFLSSLYVCKNADNQPLAYGLFVRYGTRLYYLFGAMNEEGRQNSALSVIFDHVISLHSGEEVTLDFEGGNLEGIGKYFASFGAEEETYKTLVYSKIEMVKSYF